MDGFVVVGVGGGAAGCVAAARLSEDERRRVCLVEGGPDYGPFDDGGWPADALSAGQLALAHTWPTTDDDRSKLRPRIIGGGSSINACMLALGAPPDYEWGSGWTFDVLEPFARRALNALEARQLLESELSAWHRRFLQAARAAGLDASPTVVNVHGQTRWNDAFAYLDPARTRPNLAIRGDSTVTRLEPPFVHLVDGSRLRAPLIVLAAGAYGTPALLLASALGSDLPVGEGLVDHPGVGLGWPPDKPTEETIVAQSTLRARSSLAAGEYWDLLLVPAQDGPERSAAVFSMTPGSRGTVLAGPQIDHGFLADEDAQRLVEGVQLARDLVGVDVRPGPDAELELYVRGNVRGFFHPVGTCALGRVTDFEGRLLGEDGVVICDASVIPRIPRAPTHLTVLAVAERICELLAA